MRTGPAVMALILASFAATVAGCGGGSAAAPALPGPVPSGSSLPSSPTPAPSVSPSPGPSPSPGSEPMIAGCQVFPSDNPWNQDVSGLPVDPNSATYLASMNAATTHLHPDFG